MRRFVFALERVLKHKERQERLAEMRQMQALAALRRCEQAAALLRVRWQRAGAVLPENANPRLDVAAWLARLRHVERLARDLADAEGQVHDAARVVEKASAQRRLQAREAEALRQLRQRRHEEFLDEAAKAEQRFLDEEGLRRWRIETSGAHDGANTPERKEGTT